MNEIYIMFPGNSLDNNGRDSVKFNRCSAGRRISKGLHILRDSVENKKKTKVNEMSFFIH